MARLPGLGRSATACLALAAAALATPLDDYVSKPDPHYGWFDTGTVIDTVFGGRAHVLNVTSQKWLDETRAFVPGHGSIWSHQVIVVIPKNLKHKETAFAYLTGNCNDGTPGVPGKTDEELLIVDTVTAATGCIGIIVYQLPNCHMVYPSDPSRQGRSEDGMIAWAWHEYLVDPESNPEWLPRLPMAKGAMQSMRGAAEWLAKESIANVDGWVVAGASKRGWTTWMVGAVTCDTCVNIKAIAPLVPIVPNLEKEIHRMWRAYNGFTFAFEDYTKVNLTTYVDSPKFTSMLKVVDPMYYGERLARLPKIVVLSSDDEFMMCDWSNIWYDDLTGESHLLIAPNSEHSLATGIPEVVETMIALTKSILAGETTRPSFTYKRDVATGALTVQVAPGFKLANVTLRHGETLQSQRRDFRWVRLADESTAPCKLPDIPLPKPLFGGNCIQPIVWHVEAATAGPNNTYTATPPQPTHEGHWVAYYMELLFKADTPDTESTYHFTTPAFTWPDTLPFPDCTGKECVGRLL